MHLLWFACTSCAQFYQPYHSVLHKCCQTDWHDHLASQTWRENTNMSLLWSIWKVSIYYWFLNLIPIQSDTKHYFTTSILKFYPFIAKCGQMQNLTNKIKLIAKKNCTMKKQIVPCESTGREVSLEWSLHRILSSDSKIRATLQNSLFTLAVKGLNHVQMGKFWCGLHLTVSKNKKQKKNTHVCTHF